MSAPNTVFVSDIVKDGDAYVSTITATRTDARRYRIEKREVFVLIEEGRQPVDRWDICSCPMQHVALWGDTWSGQEIVIADSDKEARVAMERIAERLCRP